VFGGCHAHGFAWACLALNLLSDCPIRGPGERRGVSPPWFCPLNTSALRLDARQKPTYGTVSQTCPHKAVGMAPTFGNLILRGDLRHFRIKNEMEMHSRFRRVGGSSIRPCLSVNSFPVHPHDRKVESHFLPRISTDPRTQCSGVSGLASRGFIRLLRCTAYADLTDLSGASM